MIRRDIPAAFVKERLRVDDDGRLFWQPIKNPTTKRQLAWNTRFADREAGRLNESGYINVTLNYQGEPNRIRAHRIVWLLVHGDWPAHEIDHINRVRHDNRPSNLRDVAADVNQINKSRPDGMLPGADRVRSRFRARCTIDGKQVHLGVFKTAEEASAAYFRAKAECGIQS